MSEKLTESLADKLNLKWVAAKRLIADAKKNCEIEGEIPACRKEEVMEEACELFKDLSKREQSSMLRSATSAPSSSSDNSNKNNSKQKQKQQSPAPPEPDWKRKAREHAERREAEWLSKKAAETQTEVVREKLRQAGVDEQEVASTRVTAIRKLTPPPSYYNNNNQVTKTQQEQPQIPPGGIVRVRTNTCYCTIQ
jgi:hypothetical protein